MKKNKTKDEIIAEHMSKIGKKGGSVKTDKKKKSSSENGKKGGRPKKVKDEQ